MIAEIGHFALILALCASLIQGVIPLIGAHKGRSDWIALHDQPVRHRLFWWVFRLQH